MSVRKADAHYAVSAQKWKGNCSGGARLFVATLSVIANIDPEARHFAAEHRLLRYLDLLKTMEI